MRVLHQDIHLEQYFEEIYLLRKSIFQLDYLRKEVFCSLTIRQIQGEFDSNYPLQISLNIMNIVLKKPFCQVLAELKIYRKEIKCRRPNLIHIAKINYTTLLKLKKKRFFNWNGDKLYDKCNWILHLFSQRV